MLLVVSGWELGGAVFELHFGELELDPANVSRYLMLHVFKSLCFWIVGFDCLVSNFNWFSGLITGW